MAALATSALAGALALLLVPNVGAQAPILANGDFEAGSTGWLVSAGATLEVDGAAGSVDGARAARVTAGGSGVVRLQSQWWTSQSVTAGVEYRLEGWVLNDDPGLQSPGLRLHFLDGDGNLLLETAAAMLAGDDPVFRPLFLDATAPPGSIYARAFVSGGYGSPK